MPTPEPLRGVITAATLDNLYQDADVFPWLGGRTFYPKKSATFNTKVREALNGRESRLQRQDFRTLRWTIKHEFLRDMASYPEVATLWDFYNACAGRFGCFYFYDPTEPEASAHQFGIGDGTTKTFTITKPVGKNSAIVEPVRAFWNSPAVTINGTPNTQFTIAPWGAITFTTAPAAGAVLRWSGKALYVCRFEEDELSMEQLVKSIWSPSGFEIKSLRP